MSKPRVLFVHNRYQLPGGEDAVADAEVELLRRNGHAVETYLRDNEELRRMNRVESFTQAVWSRRTSQDITRLVDAFQPDVIHAHNTFALVSSSLYWAAARAGIPVVQTLHNFRLMCVQAMFLYDGRVCEDCLGHVPWRGVTRKCYRNSGLQSAALAVMLGVHRTLGTFRDKVTRYIALNEFCRRKFVEGGLPASRISVKPNFVDVERPVAGGARHGGLYVGRLAPEKGIDVLMQALRELPGVAIDVIGVGPEQHQVEAHPQLNVLGWLAHGEIYERMRRASYLVMPSIWYENFPRTLVEAYANGLPVIASHLGALPELVEHGRTGLLFEAGSAHDLARHIAWAEAFPGKMAAMGEEARERYESEFTSERNYAQLTAIYRDAIAAADLRVAV
ncbi:MAG TPA: glycosyltransferase [Burkholderiales bacterium]|nr:glycosyltransferase [Burkholderiales bacterium]